MSDDLVLQRLLDRKKQLDAKIKRKQAQAKEQERKSRTRRLIEVGAVVESVLGRPFTADELPKLKIFLEAQETRGNYFSNALKKEEVNSEL